MTTIQESKVNIPDFDTIEVSTRTLIMYTDFIFNIGKIFDMLPIKEYKYVKKKRGRKKKNTVEQKEKILKDGSIIFLRHTDKKKGAIQPKKNKKTKYFRNALQIIMFVQGKKVNIKLCRTGSLHFTGCKLKQQAIDSFQHLWDYIRKDKKLYSFNDKFETGQPIELRLVPTMCNIDFDLKFTVNREALDQYFNEETDYFSMLEQNEGHAGVIIRKPFYKTISDLMVNVYVIDKNRVEFDKKIKYGEFIKTLPLKTQQKLLRPRNKRRHTFLVFHSGKVIMSGADTEFLMKNAYEKFAKTMQLCYPFVKEQLDI